MSAEPTYSLQLVKPFWSLFAKLPGLPAPLREMTRDAPPDLRVPVADGQRFLAEVVAQTGEEDLGLLAALETRIGTFDVLEFVAFSAPTWRASIETVFRYIQLMNEAADFRIETHGDKAHLVLESRVPLTRAGIDFQSGALHLTTTRWFGQRASDLQVLLTYGEPADVRRHRQVFGDAELCFDAPYNGFVFDAALLETELSSGDPSVHRVLREHIERLLAELAPGEGLVQQVRSQLVKTLERGPLTAAAVADTMGVSRRTLTRRLREEGTTFTALLEDVRKQAALHYLDVTDHSIDDIAFLVGFSESSAFVRAFKRWQGVAPATYRRTRRGG